MNTNTAWVIIWVSNWCKAEGVWSGVYHNQDAVEQEAAKLNHKDTTRKFHVVEYGGKEHEHAIMQSGKSPF
jgi:hypothetical protein